MSPFSRSENPRLYYSNSPREGGGIGESSENQTDFVLSPEEKSRLEKQNARSRAIRAESERDHMENDVPEAEGIVKNFDNFIVEEYGKNADSVPENLLKISEVTAENEPRPGNIPEKIRFLQEVRMTDLMTVTSRQDLDKLLMNYETLKNRQNPQGLHEIEKEIDAMYIQIQMTKKSLEELEVAQVSLRSVVEKSNQKNLYSESVNLLLQYDHDGINKANGEKLLFTNIFKSANYTPDMAIPDDILKKINEKRKTLDPLSADFERTIPWPDGTVREMTFQDLMDGSSLDVNIAILSLGFGDSTVNAELIKYLEWPGKSADLFRYQNRFMSDKWERQAKNIKEQENQKETDKHLDAIKDSKRREIYDRYLKNLDAVDGNGNLNFNQKEGLLEIFWNQTIAGNQIAHVRKTFQEHGKSAEGDFFDRLERGEMKIDEVIERYGEDPKFIIELFRSTRPADEQAMLEWIGTRTGEFVTAKHQEIAHEAERFFEQQRFETARQEFQSFQEKTIADANGKNVISNLSQSWNEWMSFSYAVSELSSTESRPLQTPSGQTIQARLDARTGDIIVSDNRLKNPVNIGKQSDFEKNAPILDIGLRSPELQSLFQGGKLDLMKRHMKYIENSMNRPELSLDQYETYLLTSLVSLSGVENAGEHAPSFDRADLVQASRFFEENRRDIMEWLRKNGIATPEKGIVPNVFLERLHPGHT